jgi:hypothetical protein
MRSLSRQIAIKRTMLSLSSSAAIRGVQLRAFVRFQIIWMPAFQLPEQLKNGVAGFSEVPLAARACREKSSLSFSLTEVKFSQGEQINCYFKN